MSTEDENKKKAVSKTDKKESGIKSKIAKPMKEKIKTRDTKTHQKK